MICAVLVIALLFASPPTAVAAEHAFDPGAILSKIYDWLYPRKAVPLPPPLPVEELPPSAFVPIEDIPIPLSPAVVAPMRAEPVRPKPRPRQRDDDDERPAKRQVQPANCKPITVDCNTVCGYARVFSESTMESLRVTWGYCAPTASQRLQGKACIRKQCPEVLKP